MTLSQTEGDLLVLHEFIQASHRNSTATSGTTSSALRQPKRRCCATAWRSTGSRSDLAYCATSRSSAPRTARQGTCVQRRAVYPAHLHSAFPLMQLPQDFY